MFPFWNVVTIFVGFLCHFECSLAKQRKQVEKKKQTMTEFSGNAKHFLEIEI